MPLEVKAKLYGTLMTPLSGAALVNEGDWPMSAVFVRANVAVALAALATTAYEPAIPFAVKRGAVAMPATLLVACATLPPPVNVPDAPVDGAAKITPIPPSG